MVPSVYLQCKHPVIGNIHNGSSCLVYNLPSLFLNIPPELRIKWVLVMLFQTQIKQHSSNQQSHFMNELTQNRADYTLTIIVNYKKISFNRIMVCGETIQCSECQV